MGVELILFSIMMRFEQSMICAMCVFGERSKIWDAFDLWLRYSELTRVFSQCGTSELKETWRERKQHSIIGTNEHLIMWLCL